MAEQERSYNRAHEAGRSARQAGQAMRQAAARYVQAIRSVRSILRNRHRLEATDARLIMRSHTDQARDLLHALGSTRRRFRAALATARDCHLSDKSAWRDGYSEGAA